MSEIYDDRSDMPFLSRRLKAAHEIAEAEISRSKVHEQNSQDVTANLAQIRMDGEWDAADSFERELFTGLATLFDDGYTAMRAISRTEPDAKIAVTIPAGLTEEFGYVALRRKRQFMQLTSARAELPPLAVDKISMFALDIARLAELSAEAVREVRVIVAATMYTAIDQHALQRNDFAISDEERMAFEYISALEGQTEEAFYEALENVKRFREVLKRYGISLADIEERLKRDEPTRLHDPQSVLFVEDALNTRSGLLTPSATIYYVHS